MLWLIDRGIDVRCVRLYPHRLGAETIVSVEQAIPLPSAEAYQVRAREKSVGIRQAQREKGTFTGYWFVNIGEGKGRRQQRYWEEARRHGFIGAGYKSVNQIAELRLGDRLFAYVSGEGYVGAGVVTQAATPWEAYVTEEGTRLAELDLQHEPSMPAENHELREHCLGVRWLKSVDRKHAVKSKPRRRTACRINDPDLVTELLEGFGLVVVYDVKRFGRLDNDEAGYYRHTLRTRGVEVLYVAEGFAGYGESSDTDDLLRPVKQWQARQESKDLSKVTIRGQLSKVTNGNGCWMGGVPPHGYDLRYTNERGEFLFRVRFMPDGTKRQLDDRGGAGGVVRTLERGEKIIISKRDRGQLVLSHPDRVETIRTIFRLYTEERRGLTAISSYLNERGIPTARGPGWSRIYAGLWRDSSVRAILVNPVYCGDMVWNRRTDAKFHRIERAGIETARPAERRHAYGARLVPNDQSDWVTIRETHEPLVTRRTWELAEAIREGRAESEKQRGKPKRPVGGWNGMRARFLLSGLVRCGRCGGRYQGVTRTSGKRKPDGTKYKHHYYGCGSYIAKGKSACEIGLIKQEVLENAVIDAVLAFYRERYQGEGGMERLAEAVREHLGHEEADVAAARERIEAERVRIDENIAALLDNMSAETREMIEQRLGELRTERERLKARSAELERLALREHEVHDMVQELGAFIAGLEVTLRQGVNDVRMAALRKCVEGVTILLSTNSAELHAREIPLESACSGSCNVGVGIKV